MTVSRLLPMGDRGVLVECANGPEAVAIADALTDSPAPGQLELIPGARSVLLSADRPIDAEALAARLQGFGLRPGAAAEAETVTIDVVYDGADLAEVGRATGLGRVGVMAAHTGTPWRVAFTGFAPGFGYLTGGDPRLAVPRRATPRAEVPAGAVGLAGEFSGVYPRASPGGWQLIGSTDAVLWDAERDPPALLRPGTVVHFRAVRALPDVSPTARHGPSSATRPAEPTRPGRTITVLRPGSSCLAEDLGRPGLAAQGVGRSGAADRGAARRANRIVGNRVGAAVLELIPGRVEVLAGGALLVAVTGAAAEVAVDGVPVRRDVPIPVSDGPTLTIGSPRAGLRSYLSVRGGIAAPRVLGSRSTDLLTGLGPPAVNAGDVLPVGHDHWGTPRAVQSQAAFFVGPPEMPRPRSPRSPTSRRSRSSPARRPTGSSAGWPRSPRRAGACYRRRTGSASGSTGRGCSGSGTARWPVKVCSPAPSRCRRTGGR